MKVVKIDNWGRDYISEEVICTCESDSRAIQIAKIFNEKYGGEHSPDYFKCYPDSYVAYKFEP